MCASTTFGMAWESAGGTGWPAETGDIHIAMPASGQYFGTGSLQFRAGITCKPLPGASLFVRGAAGASLRAIRLGDFLPRTIVFHMPHGVWRRLCRGNRRPPTRNRRHPMRTILPHVATAAVLATAVAILTPRGLHSAPAPGEVLTATLHAEGAQIYHCKPDGEGKLTWQFREPVATLLLQGETVGRHYAGPSWEMHDGSAVSAKVTARTPGATRERHSALAAGGDGIAGPRLAERRYNHPQTQHCRGHDTGTMRLRWRVQERALLCRLCLHTQGPLRWRRCLPLTDKSHRRPGRYSMISSAAMRRDCGMVMPMAFAVFWLMPSSNTLGAWTGRLPAFSPARIRLM